jgi:hypothetical protein
MVKVKTDVLVMLPMKRRVDDNDKHTDRYTQTAAANDRTTSESNGRGKERKSKKRGDRGE